jgi:hypothetical protein
MCQSGNGLSGNGLNGKGLSGNGLSGIARADVQRSLCPFPGYSPRTLWVLPGVPYGCYPGTQGYSGYSHSPRQSRSRPWRRGRGRRATTAVRRHWPGRRRPVVHRPGPAGMYTHTHTHTCTHAHTHTHTHTHMHTHTHTHTTMPTDAHTHHTRIHTRTHNRAYRCTYPSHTYTRTHTLTHTCTASGRCGVGAFGVPNLCCIACSRHHHGAPLVLAARDKHRCLYLHACGVDGREREDTSPSRTRTASKTTQLGAGWGPLRNQTRRSPKNRVRD